ncbi:hypothetical protein [Mesorhizobium sp. M0146]|uniref:hypothetical protein n=1 Tax=unclassified Mesorhizobium TaxID=325217 RepID=UPI00333B4BB3
MTAGRDLIEERLAHDAAIIAERDAKIETLEARVATLSAALRDTEANAELRLRMLIEANDELEAYRAMDPHRRAAREASR